MEASEGRRVEVLGSDSTEGLDAEAGADGRAASPR
jgi:hypothetical protein